MSKISIHYLYRLQEGAEQLEREGKVSTVPSAYLARVVTELIDFRVRAIVASLKSERKVHGRTSDTAYDKIQTAQIKIAILEALVVDGPCKCGCGLVYKSRHHLFMHQTRSECGELSIKGRQVAAQSLATMPTPPKMIEFAGNTYVLRGSK